MKYKLILLHPKLFHRYPLLLGRAHKATPASHPDKENLGEAQRKIEDIVEHINSVSITLHFLLFAVMSFLPFANFFKSKEVVLFQNAKESSVGHRLRRKMSASRKYASSGESSEALTKVGNKINPFLLLSRTSKFCCLKKKVKIL